jgi:probable phosphoglycerate mutase
MQIYFVRHGKTKWNQERRLQGQTGDSPLLAEAYVAIARTKAALSGLHFDKVYSSPQLRALTTANLLTDASVKADSRLSEWHFGDLEGCAIKEAVARFPKEMQDSREALDKFDGSAFGAESVASVLERFESLAGEVVKDCKCVLWVGHGASGTAGIRHLAGFPLAELRTGGGLRNTSITVLESRPKGKFEILEWDRLP